MSRSRKPEHGDTRSETEEENELTCKLWTMEWLRQQMEKNYCQPKEESRGELTPRLERPLPPLMWRCFPRVQLPPKPERDSMDPRERAAAIIREQLYFYPPIINEIVQGMDHFEEFSRDTAKDYINRAKKEIEKEWQEVEEWWATMEPERKSKADEDAFREAWADLLRLHSIRPRKEEKAVKAKRDVIVRTFEFLIMKMEREEREEREREEKEEREEREREEREEREKREQEEREKTLRWILKTKQDAILQNLGFFVHTPSKLLWFLKTKWDAIFVQRPVVQRTWEEMSRFERFWIMINGPCGGIQDAWGYLQRE